MRGLDDVLSQEFDADYMMEELEMDEEPMDVEVQRRRKKNNNNFYKRVMLSEWLVEKPSGFEENWVVKLCPVGKRCLIIANNVSTLC